VLVLYSQLMKNVASVTVSASEITYILSGGALNSTHSLGDCF